jgi:hypothetical protein
MARGAATERECSLTPMRHGRGGTRSGRSFPAQVATAFVRHDVPGVTPVEVEAAAGYVDDCLAAMPDVTRLGVSVASGAAYVVLSVLGGAPYLRQSRDTRSRSAVRLAALRLPVLSEFTRLTRGLGLVGTFERRMREARTT